MKKDTGHSKQISTRRYSALESRVSGFHDTENSVLRRILLGDNHTRDVSTVAAPSNRDHRSPIVSFVTDPKFQALYGGLDRFLAMLSWLNSRHPEKFAELPSMSFGSRNYFGRSEREILDTAPGTKAKQIPDSEFWVLVTFSNDDKKKLLRRVMRFLGYSGTDTERVLQEFPGSKKRQEFDFGDVLRQGKFVVWGSESDYDALESALTSAGISYKRSKREQFSVDPTHTTVITIMVTTTIRALAYMLATYLKERKRQIIVTKTLDGSALTADNYSVDEVERLLRAASKHGDGHIDIKGLQDKSNGSN